MWRHLTRSGAVLWVEVASSPLDFDGKNVRLVSAADVSDRVRHRMKAERLAEALELERSRLLEAFERSPSFMAMLTGPDHVIEEVNPAFRTLVGDRPLVGLTVPPRSRHG